MDREVLFNEQTIQKLRNIRKVFLWTAVWILIGELVFGAILILTQSWNISIGKIQSTFLIFALALFVGVNNFIRMEKGNRIIQGFALAGFVSGIIWAILAALLMWEILPFNWTEEVRKYYEYSGRYYDSTVYHLTLYSIAMLVFGYAASACFWISNVMSIRETIKIVKPLKITANVCVFYCWIFGTIVTIAEPEFSNVATLYQLAALAGLAFVVTSLAALIISRTNGRNRVDVGSKTEAELRAEIEEKVRREMIEKEVREKLEKENNIANEVVYSEEVKIGTDSRGTQGGDIQSETTTSVHEVIKDLDD